MKICQKKKTRKNKKTHTKGNQEKAFLFVNYLDNNFQPNKAEVEENLPLISE